ncbi:MAG: nucleoside-diphosphate sugar epimerase/dehydratase [Pseudomonadota bacterium]
MFYRKPLSLLRNRWAAYAHDLMCVPLALWLAYWARFNFETVPWPIYDGYWSVAAVSMAIQGAVFYIFGLYRGMWRFASLPDLVRIIQAVSVGAAVTFVVLFLATRLEDVPRTVLLLYPIFLVAFLTGPRLLYRWFKDRKFFVLNKAGKRALVVGAGRAGEMLVRDLINDAKYSPVGIIDDDIGKQGLDIYGVRVIGHVNELREKLAELAVDVVLIAMPSAPADVMRRIVDVCADGGVSCVTLPSISELADGRVDVSRLRKVQIEDILGRAPIDLNIHEVAGFLGGKRVLVTGAGGSIGSELCRQVMKCGPAQLLMLDNGEFNLYRISQEMQTAHPGHACVALLGDVRDASAIRRVFELSRPQVVLHAAAYKHVPLVEDNVFEGVKTNVHGTKNVADLALEFGCEKFVLVSTDKAVNPSSVMGVTKRVAEIYCQSLDQRGDTSFITTRFGNVLDSAGSVVPLFRQQIEAGGPVTVTHPEITRYFMTIPEAVSLILQAAAMGNGGEIYVLDMGEPIRIVDLAEQMIRLSGREPGRDIEIRYIGLRPGEKLFEELFHTQENLVGTRHPKILLAEARGIQAEDLSNYLAQLSHACSSYELEKLLCSMKLIVPEFSGAVQPQQGRKQFLSCTDGAD